jgi:DNA modification methylase
VRNTVLYGSALDVLKTLSPDAVQTCVTSPPYWGLRRYLFEGAVCFREDLDDETRARVIAELEALGVRPRQ